MKKLKSLDLKILVFLLFALLVFNVYPGIKSALSLNLWLPGSPSYVTKSITQYGWTYRISGPGMFYKTFFDGTVPIYSFSSPFWSPFWKPLSLYSFREATPWFLNHFKMKIIGGSEVNIPETMYLTSGGFLQSYTTGVGIIGMPPTVYLGGWCASVCFAWDYMGNCISWGCPGVGSVENSTAIFSGWEPIPPGTVLEYMVQSPAGGASLYNLNDQPFFNWSGWKWDGWRGKLVLTDYLKSIFVSGGSKTVGGRAYFVVLPTIAFQNLSVYIGNQKVYEQPGLVTGAHNIDLTNLLRGIFASQSITKGYVEVPLAIDIQDGTGNQLEKFDSYLEIDARRVIAPLRILHRQNKINLKITDRATKEIIAQRIGITEKTFEISPVEITSMRVDKELEDLDSRTKLVAKNVNLEKIIEREGCSLSVDETLVSPLQKRIKIDFSDECLGEDGNVLIFDFSDLRISPETLRAKKCESPGICKTVSTEIDRINKKVIIQRPGGESLSEFVLEQDNLKTLCPLPIKSKALKRGFRGENVRTLQQFLASDGLIYPEGLVTGYFGVLTQAAVNRFQMKYKDEILGPWNLTNPTGIAGKYTIKKINQLICQ